MNFVHGFMQVINSEMLGWMAALGLLAGGYIAVAVAIFKITEGKSK